MEGCRNCGSLNLMDLGFIGEVAPFFLKRVLNMEVRTALARHPLRLLARRMCGLPQRLFEKVYGSRAYVEMQICLHCSFVQTKYAFSEEGIGRLYADYRSATYNEERIRYEPSYAAVAKDIGVTEQEFDTRVVALTAWLSSQIRPNMDFSMLDFGGSDGRYLPGFDGRKFLFEISDIAPAAGVVKIANQSDLETYSYVQVSHVLEHVPEPLGLIKYVSSLLKPAGYLYIEVPQELADSEIAELKAGAGRRGLPIHEHINMYCTSSIVKLAEAAQLSVLKVDSTNMDFGWASGTCIRLLCNRNA
jgi:hypothetical protein